MYGTWKFALHSEPLQIPDEPAGTPEDARERYRRTRDLDPFPDIPPALLNSADIYDYVRATGMIYPFTQCRLSKPASYEVSIGRRYIYWGPGGRNVDLFLEDDEEFVLPPNSIGFVTPDEFFRLPNYIAARFNLRITNVHRGLLLGTGPLVDPGFSGQILVPLHNLTTNEYRFRQGEQFAWFEFTKLSPNAWSPAHEKLRKQYSLRGKFIPFPDEKIEVAQDPRKYLCQAAPGGVRSSIPEAIADSAQSAKQARNEAKKAGEEAGSAKRDATRARNTLYGLGAVAVIGVIVSVGALVYSSWQLLDGVHERIDQLRGQYGQLRGNFESSATSRELDALETVVGELQGRLGSRTERTVREELEAVREEIEAVRTELNALREQVGDRQAPEEQAP